MFLVISRRVHNDKIAHRVLSKIVEMITKGGYTPTHVNIDCELEHDRYTFHYQLDGVSVFIVAFITDSHHAPYLDMYGRIVVNTALENHIPYTLYDSRLCTPGVHSTTDDLISDLCTYLGDTYFKDHTHLQETLIRLSISQCESEDED